MRARFCAALAAFALTFVVQGAVQAQGQGSASASGGAPKPAASQASQYPTAAVKVVVPFAAGSSTDMVGREVARILTEDLHQSFIVENRPGAQATIGSAQVVRAAPDGYTLLLGSNTSIAAAPFLIKDVPYKPLTDFVPVARVGSVPFVLVVRPDLPVKTAAELIAYARQHPGKLTWGYANSANQGAAAGMTKAAGLETTAVPYTGVPQLVVDMLGGRLDFAIIDVTNAAPQIKSGKLRALAVTPAREIGALPGVPPLGATLPGFELVGWYGLYAPAGTPQAVVDRLSAALLKGLGDSTVKQHFAQAGLETYPASAKELASFGQAETVKWQRLAHDAGITPQ
ncbi:MULTISPECIES: tripartite tricarboxylate transporter substrate binding protein [unclassified Achromobacter]|uniref:Bug family tripartite tricarboxylate transporter substrate binding protein n=1 Tax=unclassified Achromobacter TaxID=2626865 RepID=UPI000B515458|nr:MULTISPECIES: tripartite tricarboxylate transporter substrate binding protein [unclassified Achromobacter]OWT70291.1 ABC transporter substrate-binding protein [Achromobacter sp. HZ34]OWT71831.1 ABC transporter substrate-binding protein [Achromobacter sp. HZ28]